MKKHIVRAPQTDRYGFEVPTRLSDLEDDITTTRLALTSVIPVAGAAPVSAAFVMDAGVWTGAAGATRATGTTVTENVGFTLPTTGDLLITIPATGVYAINLVSAWVSGVDTTGGVGFLVTNYNLALVSAADPAVSTPFVGVAGVDNKVGPVSLAGFASLQSNAVLALTAGDVLTCATSILAESPAMSAAGLLASITLQIVRIA